jgi:hypothetical protein
VLSTVILSLFNLVAKDDRIDDQASTSGTQKLWVEFVYKIGGAKY